MSKEEFIIHEFRQLNEESQKLVLGYIEYLKWKHSSQEITATDDLKSNDLKNTMTQDLND